MKKEKIQCSICLEDFVVGSEVRTLPCTHFFHLSCIDTWLKGKKKKKKKKSISLFNRQSLSQTHKLASLDYL